MKAARINLSRINVLVFGKLTNASEPVHLFTLRLSKWTSVDMAFDGKMHPP